MEEIELSVMVHTPQTANILRQLLQEFQVASGIHVNLTCLDWVTARAELNKSALYHRGPDVSEVGSTWVPDLISMNVLSPLLPYDTQGMVKGNDFARAAWSTVQMPEDNYPWALPWHAETYIIHYRKDLLAKAELDETTAFATHAEIEKTAARLAERGISVPVELTLQTDRYGMLHTLASWVWAYGGDFLSKDGKRLLLNQPKSMQALSAYFALLQYASESGRQEMREKTHTPLFHLGHSAITFGTVRMAMPESAVPNQVKENWGWAGLPQPCFVGGSNIVIWKHTHNKRAALKLVEFLTSPDTLSRVNPQMATLPPRLDVLRTSQFTENPMYRVMGHAITHGRAYPPLRLWGLVEEKLVSALLQIGAELLESPKEKASEIIESGVATVTRRVDMLLAQ